VAKKKRLEKFNGVPIIDDETPERFLFPPDLPNGYGLVPRDYNAYPLEMFAPPSDMKVIAQSEWDARIKEQEEQQSSLEHIWRVADNGQQPKNLYQNGDPLCWAHSTVNAVMVSRAAANEPYVALSAYMVAMLTNRYQNSGGWCGQSAAGVADFGVCTQKFWPQQNRSRSNDTPEMRADAAKRKIKEEWRDLSRTISGQRLTWEQVATCALLNQAMAVDFMWWRHSVCGMRLVRVEAGSYGLMILNSHGDNDGDRGFHILRGSRARPDGAIAIRSLKAAA
jgi:hypothetical protein